MTLRSFLTLMITLLIFSIANSQSSQKSDDSYDFKEHLWYGVNLGNIGIGSNTFSLGVAPMGGYKFNDYIALGVITKLNYTYMWQRLGDNFHFLDYGVGALGRVKFLKGKYFAQVEYDIMSISTWNGLGQVRESYPFMYIGGGMTYPGNGKWSSEISALYNLHPDSNQLFFPLTLNYAFIYNF